MVNNAGITRSDAAMRKMTEDQFDQVIAIAPEGTWNRHTRGRGDRTRATTEQRDRRGYVVDLRQGSAIGQTAARTSRRPRPASSA